MKLNLKIQELRQFVRSYKKIAIALSGGIDSCTLLAFCVQEISPDNVLAVIGDAPYMISEEINYAKNMCMQKGVLYKCVDVQLPEILKGNPPERCYLCKQKIFACTQILAKSFGAECVFDGSNVDDAKEHRLGDRAKMQFDIESPFAKCGFYKDDIRALAISLGLQMRANRASATCLMTRFKTGLPVSLNELNIVERAELFIKSLGFNLVRVRSFSGHYEIQTAVEDIAKLKSIDVWSKVLKYFNSQNIYDVSVAENGYKFGCMQ